MASVDKLRTALRQVRWSRIDPDGPGFHAPKRHLDVGWDLEVAEEREILPGRQDDVPTNIRLELPDFIWAEVRARSSAARRHLQIEAGTIDPGYRGPIYALVRNIGRQEVQIMPGERVAQIVFHKVEPVWIKEVPSINDDTQRGQSGFGSTGR